MTANNVAHQTREIEIVSASLPNGTLTMSSREIAELTGKRHDHVIRDIEKMLSELTHPKFGVSDFLTSYKDSTGRSLKEYCLPKRETMILVSGYSIPLRAAIVDRWQALEEAVASPMQRALASREVSLPADVTEMIRRSDGILRMLAHKVTEQEKVVAEQGKALAAIGEVVSPSVPGVYTPGKRLVVILEEAGFTKRPRGLVNFFGDCLAKAGIFPTGKDYMKVRLYPQDKVNEWLGKSGHTTIARYIAEKRGQNSLSLTGWNIRRMKQDAPDGRGVIHHKGEAILYDANDISLNDGDEAVAILVTGEVTVETVIDRRTLDGVRWSNYLGPREILSAIRTEEVIRRGVTRTQPVQYAGLILGKVIDRKPLH